MNRIEEERRRIVASGSTLLRHSTNQRTIRLGIEGSKRAFSEPRKARMSRRRKERNLEQQLAYKEAKLSRILERVLTVKQGIYDGFCIEGFCREVRFLKANNIPIPIYTSSSLS